MTFLFLALVRHLRWSNRTVLLIALATSAVSHFLNFRSTGNPLFDLLGGWLWYSNGDSWFPFLNWLLFPVFGYLFGSYLQRCTDKERLYRIITPVCLIPSVSYVLFCFVYRVGLYSHWSRTYCYEFIDAVFVAMLCIGQLGVFYFITTRLLAGKMEIFRGLGSNITIVYWWHYLFIKWSSAIMRILGMDHVWPFWLCTVVAIVILALSHCIAFSYRKVLSRYKLSF